MGERGPVNKRSDQLRRRNKSEVSTDSALGASEVDVPDVAAHWHPVAKLWFESLAASGQSVFYQPSDWAMAYLMAESLSRDLKPQFVGVNPETGRPINRTIPLKGASLAAYLKGMTALLVTEGDRRRMRLELEAGPPSDDDEDAADAAVFDLHAKLHGTG